MGKKKRKKRRGKRVEIRRVQFIEDTSSPSSIFSTNDRENGREEEEKKRMRTRNRARRLLLFASFFSIFS